MEPARKESFRSLSFSATWNIAITILTAWNLNSVKTFEYFWSSRGTLEFEWFICMFMKPSQDIWNYIWYFDMYCLVTHVPQDVSSHASCVSLHQALLINQMDKITHLWQHKIIYVLSRGQSSGFGISSTKEQHGLRKRSHKQVMPPEYDRLDHNVSVFREMALWTFQSLVETFEHSQCLFR